MPPLPRALGRPLLRMLLMLPLLRLAEARQQRPPGSRSGPPPRQPQARAGTGAETTSQLGSPARVPLDQQTLARELHSNCGVRVRVRGGACERGAQGQIRAPLDPAAFWRLCLAPVVVLVVLVVVVVVVVAVVAFLAVVVIIVAARRTRRMTRMIRWRPCWRSQ